MTFIVDGTNGLTFNNSTVQASAGVVLQVVNATYSTQTSTASGTYTATGLTASITPKFSTSKILIIVTQSCAVTGSIYSGINLRLFKNSTGLLDSLNNFFSASTTQFQGYIAISYLDSPATTSSTTYSTSMAQQTGGAGTVLTQAANSGSTITLMEIAG